MSVFRDQEEKVVEEVNSYLSFKLDNEFFALDVKKVIEIIEVPHITSVPLSPSYMSGIINLRGKVLPLIDTKVKFGLEPVEYTIDTCIIVIEIKVEDEVIQVGTLVDQVLEVIEIGKSHIQPSPTIEAKYPLEYIQGMFRKDDNFIMLVSLEKVFSIDEVYFMQDTNDNEQEQLDSKA